MIKRIFSNFWGRNMIFFCLIMILARMNNDKGSIGDFNLERFKIYFSYFIDYVWVLLHNKILIERFFLKKKLKTYCLLLLGHYILYLPFYYFINAAYSPTAESILTAVMSLTAVMLLGLGLYFIVRYIIDRERFYRASINAKELEMQLLKGQLNPHFLFNALNNIYSHLITDSKNGQELILKLSELMRYILDSNKREMVGLAEELKFIDNYLAFEKERLGERCEIIVQKEILDETIQIAPLILFTFIENAFKHGTLAIKKSRIELKINSNKQTVVLEVSNPVQRANENSTRIGLSNTVRRLELLYPENHELKVKEEEERYQVYFRLAVNA